MRQKLHLNVAPWSCAERQDTESRRRGRYLSDYVYISVVSGTAMRLRRHQRQKGMRIGFYGRSFFVLDLLGHSKLKNIYFV